MHNKPAITLLFTQQSLLYHPDDKNPRFPYDLDTIKSKWQSHNYLLAGQWEGQDVWVAQVSDNNPELEHYAQISLKAANTLLPEPLFLLALKGLQLLHWQSQTRYCGACGHATKPLEHDIAMRCPICGASFYPKVAPAVIVRVTRGREILLARSPHFPKGMYAHIAGFIEPGESAESAIARELAEETSLKVKNINYFGSQSWPFPDSYMLAFTAEYASGEIQIDEIELSDARWFTPDTLPRLPRSSSISRHLLDDYINQHA